MVFCVTFVSRCRNEKVMIEEVSNFLNQIRSEFSSRELSIESVKDNPIEQYAVWFEEAVGAQLLDPKAMVLSTVSAEGKPSSRVLYVRGIDEHGFLFYTNYHSRKAKELEANPNVAVNIFWPELERQIRAEGIVERLPAEKSDEYFKSRPRESQIGAWASHQSEQLGSRKELEDKVAEFTKKFEGKEVPRPPFWGGYYIRMNYFEFWQGRPARLHDRIAFRLENGRWKKFRLSP